MVLIIQKKLSRNSIIKQQLNRSHLKFEMASFFQPFSFLKVVPKKELEAYKNNNKILLEQYKQQSN
jgi:hypothetical protein